MAMYWVGMKRGSRLALFSCRCSSTLARFWKAYRKLSFFELMSVFPCILSLCASFVARFFFQIKHTGLLSVMGEWQPPFTVKSECHVRV
jgi:hypothetical protein